ncbi:hypothetical protein ACWDOR_21505 [Streptosporangium canum]
METALLIPRLILADHTPEQAEALAEQAPAWKAAPETAVTDLAAVWSLFREYVARNGPERIRASRPRSRGRPGMAGVPHQLPPGAPTDPRSPANQ